MRVLLTGYSGFLGRHIARVLIKEEFYVRVLLNRKTILRQDVLKESHEVQWGSIEDQNTVQEALRDIAVVVQCAWTFNHQDALHPTVNETGSELLIKESIKAGVKKFVFISSVAVYGMKKKHEGFIDESNPTVSEANETFIYPVEKYSVENSLRSLSKGNIELGIFRPGPIFDDSRGIIKKDIHIFGSDYGIGIGHGRNKMAFIHAQDVANAVLQWVNNGKGSCVFNVTPSRCLSYKEWYAAWGKLHGKRIKPLFIPGFIFILMSFAIKTLKRLLKKESKSDVKYAVACATRDLCYSNLKIKETLKWSDKATQKYLNQLS